MGIYANNNTFGVLRRKKVTKENTFRKEIKQKRDKGKNNSEEYNKVQKQTLEMDKKRQVSKSIKWSDIVCIVLIKIVDGLDSFYSY